MRLDELPMHARRRVQRLLAASDEPTRRQEPPAVVQAAGGVRARPLRNGVDLWLAVDPPTATHHAKKIARMGRRWALIDKPELKRARRLYLMTIPACPGAAIRPPYSLAVQFRFAGEELAWWAKKPDADNAEKTLCDCLVKRGWLERDERVVRLNVEKVAVPAGQEGIMIRLRQQARPPVLWTLARSL